MTVERPTIDIAMVPNTIIASTSKSFMEHIKVQKPLFMRSLSGEVDMGVQPVLPLYHCKSITIVPGVVVAFWVGNLPIEKKMEIEPLKATDRATPFLVVSAPGIAFA